MNQILGIKSGRDKATIEAEQAEVSELLSKKPKSPSLQMRTHYLRVEMHTLLNPKKSLPPPMPDPWE